jgi:hypothetical protein
MGTSGRELIRFGGEFRWKTLQVDTQILAMTVTRITAKRDLWTSVIHLLRFFLRVVFRITLAEAESRENCAAWRVRLF